jgi:hypothetical protein
MKVIKWLDNFNALHHTLKYKKFIAEVKNYDFPGGSAIKKWAFLRIRERFQKGAHLVNPVGDGGIEAA